MSQFIENAKWRYATKKFDTTKKISNENLEILKEAIQLSASSFGLQPYKVIIVDNPEIRAQLVPASWGQPQIVDASHLIVFASNVKVFDEDIDAYINNTATTRNVDAEALKGYGDYMKNHLKNFSEDAISIWTAKQTYIALGNLLNAASELKIDVTPMEGFDPQQYNEILGLNKLGLTASLVATLGYRHEEDQTQHQLKVRKPKNELFINI